jgi:hypothetical protein
MTILFTVLVTFNNNVYVYHLYRHTTMYINICKNLAVLIAMFLSPNNILQITLSK